MLFLGRLINALMQCKQLVVVKINEGPVENQDEITTHLDKMIKTVTSMYLCSVCENVYNFFEFSENMIAGNTTEYVNRIIDKVKGGGTVVGLDDL